MILQGDALSWLKQINNESIDCIITSPPYWALRDYKVEGQLGQEKTIDEYVSKLVEIFNECKRVLKREGTCWIVLGDTYSGGGGEGKRGDSIPQVGSTKRQVQRSPSNFGGKTGLQDKTLCLIPERFAIKMIDNGWILRNKIIWHKPNCMPSSATDRFTVDFEYIYFFVKSKRYYFKTQYEPFEGTTFEERSKYNFGGYKKGIDHKNGRHFYLTESKQILPNPQGRIKRTVWKIPPKPFPEAHFAVFPEELVKQCLDAGCSSTGMVLDPFAGAGTTGVVSLQNHRNWIGIELNPDYIKISRERLRPYWEQLKLPIFG